ncbi:TIGR02300 family protein, partial [Hyphomonas atlantica]|uniref:TIGR02300 family protein n=1 Tax=Hyphomonas atlantica TaxID=1280948 RepID=UPI00351160A5
MSKDKLGTKQVCPSCEARFYDLNKRPCVCPKCGEEFDPEDEVIRTTITKVKAKAAKAAVKTEDDDEDDDEEDAAARTNDDIDDEDDESDEEEAKELGGDEEEVILEGSSDEDEDGSQDKVLINAFKEGKDIHATTAQEVFGDMNEELRRIAKTINFGII